MGAEKQRASPHITGVSKTPQGWAGPPLAAKGEDTSTQDYLSGDSPYLGVKLPPAPLSQIRPLPMRFAGGSLGTGHLPNQIRSRDNLTKGLTVHRCKGVTVILYFRVL